MKSHESAKKGAFNDSHRRRIASALAVVEARLDEIERWLSAPDGAGTLRRRIQDLAPDTGEKIARQTQAAREAVHSATASLGLASQDQTASKFIQSAAAFSLIDLEELSPRKLKGYGGLDTDSAGALQEILDALRTPLEEIRRLAGREERPSESEKGPQSHV